MIPFEAIVLAGSLDKRLFPLTANQPKALLPVGNEPLLSYPLLQLKKAGARKIFLVVAGEEARVQVNQWLGGWSGSAGLPDLEMVTVEEETGSADVVRRVAGRLSPTSLLMVMGGDVVSDVPLDAVVMLHHVSSASATVTLHRRKGSVAETTKPGKSPRGVDYIGLDAANRQLLCYATSPGAVRDVRVPAAMLRAQGRVSITTGFIDSRIYVFSGLVLDLLEKLPMISSIQGDLLPHLTQTAFLPKPRAPARQQTGDSEGMEAGTMSEEVSVGPSRSTPALDASTLPGADFMHLMHNATEPLPRRFNISVFLADEESFCACISDLEAYGDTNRGVAHVDVAPRLLGLSPSRHDNFVHAAAELGAKTTIAAGCIIGEGSKLGDKCTVKRSVIGRRCSIAANVKVINSVIMDEVVLEEGGHVQNTLVCKGAVIGRGANLKDCKVGPAYVIADGSDCRGDMLAKDKPL